METYDLLEQRLNHLFASSGFDGLYFMWTHVVKSLNFHNEHTFTLDEVIATLLKRRHIEEYAHDLVEPVENNTSTYQLFEQYTCFDETIAGLGVLWREVIDSYDEARIRDLSEILNLFMDFLFETHEEAMSLMKEAYGESRYFKNYEKRNKRSFKKYMQTIAMTIHTLNIIIEYENRS